MLARTLDTYFSKSAHFDCFKHEFFVSQVKPKKFQRVKIFWEKIKMSYQTSDAIDALARTFDTYFSKSVHFDCLKHDFSVPQVKPRKFRGVKIFWEKNKMSN